MAMQHIHSDETAAPLLARSDTVLTPPCTAILVSSGMLGMRKDGTIPESTEEQVEAAFDNVEAVLRAAVMETGDIVKMMIFTTDARYRDAFRAVHAKRVGEPAPASTRVVITPLSMPEPKVEIENRAIV